jgi:predicted enzyme related to lactoylglutathione lyase
VLRDLFRKGEEFEEANAIVERQIRALSESGAAIVEDLTTDIPNVGRYARVQDTEGNVIGVIKPIRP